MRKTLCGPRKVTTFNSWCLSALLLSSVLGFVLGSSADTLSVVRQEKEHKRQGLRDAQEQAVQGGQERGRFLLHEYTKANTVLGFESFTYMENVN